jgi:alanine racemase
MHTDMPRDRAWCEIDGGAIRHNAETLRRRSGTPLVPMVKADAYGVGALAALRALEPLGADTVWGFGIATVEEGSALRAHGCQARILCCTPVLPSALSDMAAHRITPALHRDNDIRAWRALTDAPYHLAIDTGMHRAGVEWHAVDMLREVLTAHPPEGVFTHFHSADQANGSVDEQETRFAAALHRLPLPATVLRHVNNTYGVLRDPTTATPNSWHLSRPGIGLYGVPSGGGRMRPVLHVYARVIDIRTVRAGESVSYDATWRAPRDARIATVAVGHGDGYRRHLSNKAVMLLHGHRVPVVGLITMDMTMIDVTDAPCTIGDVVTVLGSDPLNGETLSVEELAAAGGVSPYELLVGWRLRLPRFDREASP